MKYQELAKECGICIVPGTIVEGHRGEEKEEDRLLNVAYFIGKDGEILGKYVKKNLWYVDTLFYSANNPLIIVFFPALVLSTSESMTISQTTSDHVTGAQSAIT